MSLFGNNGWAVGRKNTPTVISASGIWVPNEQSLARRAAIWPTDNPIPGLSPALWYDFADATMVTTSSGLITAVTDQGSFGANLSASGAARPTYTSAAMNGKNVCEWPDTANAQWLKSDPLSSPPGVVEVYVALKFFSGSSFPDYNGVLTVNQIGAPSGFRAAASTGFDGGTFNAGYYLNRSGTTASTADRTSNVFPEVVSPCIIRAYSNIGGMDFAAGVSVGMDRAYDYLNRGWRGYIGEIVGFTTALGTTDRNTLVNHLCDKWGIFLD